MAEAVQVEDPCCHSQKGGVRAEGPRVNWGVKDVDGSGVPLCTPPRPRPGLGNGLGGTGSRGTRARGADTPKHSCPRSPRTTTAPSAAGEGSGGNPLEVLLWCHEGHVARLGRTEPGEPDVDQQVP